VGRIERRLEDLEKREARNRSASDPTAALADFGDAWTLDEQLAVVADKLDVYIHFHSQDDIQYAATRREIHLLGILCAMWELGAEGGEYTFPSGLTLRFIPEGEGLLIDVPRRICAEDLPEWTREHFKQGDLKGEEEREQFLFETRERPFVPWRERVRQVEEEQKRRAEESRRRDREYFEKISRKGG
jgi:hypothetical protein